MKLLASCIDEETLRTKDIMKLRDAANKKFGFFDKLCVVTERCKIYSDHFLDRKPKFIRDVHQRRTFRNMRLQNRERLAHSVDISKLVLN